jgi:hypothetical protein
MSVVLIGFIFVVALLVGIIRGPGWCFVLVYLPALMLFSQVQEFTSLPHLPISAATAPLYAMLISIPINGGSFKLRWNSLDTVFALLLICGAITGWTTALFESGVNIFRTDFLNWMLPYYAARIAFRDWEKRRAALFVLIPVMFFIWVVAAIEFRFTPYFYLHLMQSAGMANKIPVESYNRFGFYRVAGTVEHPIYFGNMSVVLVGLIAVLATTSGYRVRKPIILATLLAAASCVGMSISGTPTVGSLAALICMLGLLYLPYARKLLLPGVAAVAGGLFMFTYTVAHEPLGLKPEGEMAGSLYTRKLIISESWKIAVNAGPFGNGLLADYSDVEGFDLASVDNSYMQFTMNRGWVYTGLWSSICLVVAVRMTKAFLSVRNKSQIFPLAACTGVCLGLMLSMYTVWAGATYTIFWCVLLGLANTLADQVIEAAKEVPVAVGPGAAAPGIRLRAPVVPYRPAAQFARG